MGPEVELRGTPAARGYFEGSRQGWSECGPALGLCLVNPDSGSSAGREPFSEGLRRAVSLAFNIGNWKHFLGNAEF